MYVTQQSHTLGANDINIGPLVASVMQSSTDLFTSQCLRLEDIAMNNINNMYINTQWKFAHPQKILLIIVHDITFFHTHLWFPASDCDFWQFGSDFWSFCKVITEQKHCGRKRIDHGHLYGKEFTLVSLYSTEITRYCLWLLKYKLTWVNSVPHGRPWWILYVIFVWKSYN